MNLPIICILYDANMRRYCNLSYNLYEKFVYHI